MRILAVSFVLAAVACGGSKPKPAAPPSNLPVAEPEPAPAPPPSPPRAGGPSDAEFEAMMGKAVAMFNAMGAAADANGNDCGKFADSLDQIMVDNAQFLADARKYKDDPEMDKRGEEWMKAHQDEVMGPMMKVAGAGQKCASDAKFMATMERLGKLGE